MRYLNCSETSHFQKSFAWSRKMCEQGRAWQQTVTRGNQGITHSSFKTVADYSRTAWVCSLPQSPSSAPMSSLLKSITTHCLITKVQILTFIFFPTKDKQLLRQDCRCTLITVHKQTEDYKLLMRSLRLYRSGFSNCCSLNKGILLIIGFVLSNFEKFAVLFKWYYLLLDFFLKELNRTICPFSWPCFRKVFGHIVSQLLFINS